MAESAADSTKSEDDSSEGTDSKLHPPPINLGEKTSLGNPLPTSHNETQDASSNDNGQVSSSDAREPSQTVIQPSKFSAVHRASGVS
ncbi:unnamed protein product, partial [Candidula unifasciata]